MKTATKQKTKVTIKIGHPEHLMDMLMFIKRGLDSGSVTSKPILIMDDPKATHYETKYLEEMIDEAIEKAW